MTAHVRLCPLLLAAAGFALGLAMPGDAAELNPAALGGFHLIWSGSL